MPAPRIVPTRIERVVRQFAAELRRELGPRLDRVILFGSRARGTARPGSDLDCLVVLERKEPAAVERIHDLAYGLSLEHGVDLSVKVYGREGFAAAVAKGNPFLLRVLEEGLDF